MNSAWSFSKETQSYRKTLEEAKKRIVDVVTNGTLLYGEKKWEYEYPRYLGMLESIEFAIKQLNEVKDD